MAPAQNRSKKSALLVAIALSLSGCFDLNQVYTFNADSSVDIEIEMAVAAEMVAQEPDLIDCEGIAGAEGQANVQRFTRDTDEVCMTATTVSLAEFQDFFYQLTNADEMSGSFEATENGYELSLTVLPIPMDAESNQEFGFSEADMRAMATALMAGRAYRWTIEAPRILSADGEVNETQTIAQVSIPLVQLIAENAEPQTRRITFSMEP